MTRIAPSRPSRLAVLLTPLLALLAGGALAEPAAARQPAAVTIEALMSAPFPYGMRAAPAGGHVAWVQNDRGVRNIWVAAPPAAARQLTAYAEDDGQELSIAAWTPDGRTLLYVRGGGTNRQGEHPNPTSDPEGAEQVLWRVALDGGAPARVAAAANAAVAPDGSRLVFTRGGQIWIAPLDGGEPQVLARVRGGPGSLQWSPDGTRLAFVSNRGTHAFVGVLDVAARAIRWLDPGVDRDGNPAWSPDGRRIAFIRIAASSDIPSFRAARSAHPWSIRVADVATGRSTEIWRAREGVGSRFYGVTAANQLLWGADDRIVFPWEGTGWVLLHSVPAAGGTATLLTPGAFEVADAALAPDGRHVYYSSNQDDMHRRHLWRVPVAGGRAEPLTAGQGIEWEPTPLSNGGVAFFRSGARTPAHAAFLPPAAAASAGTGERARPLIAAGQPGAIPAGFPERALVAPQAVSVTAADGMEVPAQLFLPPDLRAGERRPAIAFFHGGSRRQMLLGFHDRSYYHYAYALNQYLALQGYIVLSVNFRSGTGYGMEFREALDYGAGGGSEFNDVTGAGLYLRSRTDVDPARIGIWGGSYGGYLTAMGLSRASHIFAAGVDVHGVHDWNVGIATFRPDYSPLDDPDAGRVAFLASPMATLDGWRSPVLLIHGDDDRNVRFVETVSLVEELRKRDVHVELLVFPDEVHSFLLHSNWLASYEATADFFDRMLRQGGAARSARR